MQADPQIDPQFASQSDPQLLYSQGLQAFLVSDYATGLNALEQSYIRRRGVSWRSDCEPALWLMPERWPRPTRVTLPKLRHDAEQLTYLTAEGLLPEHPFLEGLQAFSDVHAELQAQGFSDAIEPVSLNEDQGERLRGWLGRHWYAKPLLLSEPILNPELDYEALEAAYLAQKPGFSVMDKILTPANQNALWQYFQQASIWHDYWRGAYMGAYLEDGCHGPWLAQLAAALRQAFPKTLGRFPLSACWAYKYDAQHPGIGAHADTQAQMLWSVWLTPDTSNLAPERSGLNIYALTVPPDFRGEQTADPAFRETLQRTPFVQVPYRCNRAILFYGGLVHSSDRLYFKPGYFHRRMNLTLVFGLRPYGPESQHYILTRPLLPVCQ
jgi:hypothetical protein